VTTSPSSGKKTVYAQMGSESQAFRLLSTPGGDDTHVLTNCSRPATRAMALEPARKAVEAPGVPLQSGARARAPLSPARTLPPMIFRQEKRGR